MISFKRMLCPVDFSNTSSHALETAIELATKLDATIHLVHVYQYPVFSISETDLATPIDMSLQESYIDHLKEQLDELCKKYSALGITMDSTLVDGVPYVEIVQTAKNIEADLIVIGTHGRTGLSHMLLGSVAERVVRSSTVPVLSVPDK